MRLKPMPRMRIEETLPQEEVESNDEENEIEANAQDENRRIFTPGGG